MTKVDKIAWDHYSSLNEIHRLQRVNPFIRFNCNIKDDLTPNYNKDLNIGVVIGTYGGLSPYIKLQLYYLKEINKIDNILVVDDYSDERNQLANYCKQLNIDFASTPIHLPYIKNVGSNGDTYCFYKGLQWAKEHNIDILVKLSKRLIPQFNWKSNFIELIHQTDALTYSSYCIKDRFNFRTECVGMDVNSWSHFLNVMNFYLSQHYIIFAEYWFHELAKTLSFYNKSKKWSEYQNTLQYDKSGYAHWYDILGDDRYSTSRRHDGVLWHMYNTEEDYINCLKKLNIENIKN